jgi:hypothetical protein
MTSVKPDEINRVRSGKGTEGVTRIAYVEVDIVSVSFVEQVDARLAPLFVRKRIDMQLTR